jgi:hypothetical protein
VTPASATTAGQPGKRDKLAQLWWENRRLRENVEILKLAAASLAKETR